MKNLVDLQRNQAGGDARSGAGARPLYYLAHNDPRYVNAFINKGL